MPGSRITPRAKLPPAPKDAARFETFRDMVMEIAQASMTIIRVAAPAAERAAAEREAALQAEAELNRQATPTQPDAAPAAPPSPGAAHAAPPNPPGPIAQTPGHAAAAPPETAQKPRAITPPRRRATRLDPLTIFLHCARLVHACIRLDAELATAAAQAHTTAEQAGRTHPNRQPILDYLHEAIRAQEPYFLQRTTHDDMETRVSEELGIAPHRNPGDIIAELCAHYQLPNNPADYPNNWRPTRNWHQNRAPPSASDVVAELMAAAAAGQ